VAVSYRSGFAVHDLSARREIAFVRTPVSPACLSFSNRETLRVGFSDSTVQVFDLSSGQLSRMDGWTKGRPLALVSDGEFLIANSLNGTVASELSDLERWRVIDPRAGSRIALHQGILFLAACDGIVRVIDVRANHILGEPQGHTSAISGLAMNPDAPALFTCGYDGRIIKWNIDGTMDRTVMARESGLVGLGWLRDGHIAAGSLGGNLSLRSIDSLRCRRESTVGALNGLWTSASGDTLFLLLHDGSLHFQREGESRSVALDGTVCSAVSIGDDDIACGLDDGRVILISTRNFQTIEIARRNGDRVTSMAAASGGQLIVWGTNANIVVASARNTSRPRTVVTASPISALAVSDDGSIVVSAHSDRVLRVWDSVSLALLSERHGLWPAALSIRGFDLTVGCENGRAFVTTLADPSLYPVCTSTEDWLECLSSDDAAQITSAIGGALLDPVMTVQRIKKWIQNSCRSPDIDQTVRLLEDDDIATRDAAMKYLERLGLFAEGSLRHWLTRMSEEGQHRIRYLLGGLVWPDLWLRYGRGQVRAVMLLEMIGGRTAEEILATLASSGDGVLAERAGAALARIRKRKP
jgi:WD40 repeat protein